MNVFQILKIYSPNSRNVGGRDRTRMLVRMRDKFTCQDCGKIRTIEQAKKEKKR